MLPLLSRLARLIGWPALAASIGVVAAVLAWQAVQGPVQGQPVWPTPALRISLLHTLWMATAATIAAMLLALPAAIGLSIAGRRTRGILAGLSILPLLTMPSTYAYALLVLTTGRNPAIAALTRLLGWSDTNLAPLHAGLILACWLWPIPALLLAAGFRHAGAPAYKLASLDAPPLRAFIRAALPAMSGPLIAAGAAVFILAALDSTVPPFVAASRVWGVELMADFYEAAGTARPAAYILFRAWSIIAIIALIALAARPAVQSMLAWQADPDGDTGASPRSGRALSILATLAAALLALGPVAIYAPSMFDGRYTIAGSFAEAWRSGHRALGTTLVVSAATGALAMTLALALLDWSKWPRWKRRANLLVVIALAAVALLPPAMTATTLVSFFSAEWISPARGWNLYDRTPWVWIAAMLCRYAFIPVFALRIMNRRIPYELPAQAETDGATPPQSLAHARLPFLLRPLLIAGLFVAGLTFSDVAASSLTQPPQWGGGSLAVWTDGQMHYGRHNHTTALALIMLAPGMILAAAVSARTAASRSIRSGPSEAAQ